MIHALINHDQWEPLIKQVNKLYQVRITVSSDVPVEVSILFRLTNVGILAFFPIVMFFTFSKHDGSTQTEEIMIGILRKKKERYPRKIPRRHNI